MKRIKNLEEMKKGNEVKMNFLKKKCMDEKYEKIRKMLIENGFKPSNNIRHSYSFDCKRTKHSFFSPATEYPYSITIRYQKQSVNEYRLAA